MTSVDITHILLHLTCLEWPPAYVLTHPSVNNRNLNREGKAETKLMTNLVMTMSVWAWSLLLTSVKLNSRKTGAEYMSGKGTDLGSPSVSWTRWSLSSIICVGPPPPSPKPNSTALWLALPLSLLCLTVFTSWGQRKTQINVSFD